MRRFWGLAMLALVLATDAFAQSYPKYVFVAVDAVSVQPGRVTITEILEGESAAVSRFASFGTYEGYGDALQACHRAALLAMEKPGAYRLEVVVKSSTSSDCALVRVNP